MTLNTIEMCSETSESTRLAFGEARLTGVNAMSAQQSLRQRIREKLDAAEERIDEERRILAQEMQRRELRRQQFSQLTARLIPAVVEPRVEEVVESFPNAELQHSTEGIGHYWKWTFAHTREFPATVELMIGIEHDDSIDNLVLQYTLEIVPVFFQFERHCQLVLPIESVLDDVVAEWIEGRILEFVDNYQQIEQVDQYRRETLVTDPVCGMQISRRTSVGEEQVSGRTYYFCTESCRQKFQTDPSQYVKTR
jgi:YHS domain-containing protein